MADKTAELRRINEPRVRRAIEQLGFIEKSAASLRADPADVRALVAPLKTRLAQMLGAENERKPLSGPLPDDDLTPEGEVVAAKLTENITPPVAREMVPLATLSTQQLVDRMIACGAELAKRRQ